MSPVGYRTAWLCLLVPFLAPMFSGCRSPQSTPSTLLASVVIKERPSAQVEAVTRAVFEDHGYLCARRKPGEFVFEQEGTGMNTLVYGDWSSKKVWVRVKVFLRELAPAQQLLVECDAYMVIDRGDAHFEEERKLTRVHRGRYQDLLNEVSKRVSLLPAS
jgi:hypothetical protein